MPAKILYSGLLIHKHAMPPNVEKKRQEDGEELLKNRAAKEGQGSDDLAEKRDPLKRRVNILLHALDPVLGQQKIIPINADSAAYNSHYRARVVSNNQTLAILSDSLQTNPHLHIGQSFALTEKFAEGTRHGEVVMINGFDESAQGGRFLQVVTKQGKILAVNLQEIEPAPAGKIFETPAQEILPEGINMPQIKKLPKPLLDASHRDEIGWYKNNAEIYSHYIEQNGQIIAFVSDQGAPALFVGMTAPAVDQYRQLYDNHKLAFGTPVTIIGFVPQELTDEERSSGDNSAPSVIIRYKNTDNEDAVATVQASTILTTASYSSAEPPDLSETVSRLRKLLWYPHHADQDLEVTVKELCKLGTPAIDILIEYLGKGLFDDDIVVDGLASLGSEGELREEAIDRLVRIIDNKGKLPGEDEQIGREEPYMEAKRSLADRPESVPKSLREHQRKRQERAHQALGKIGGRAVDIFIDRFPVLTEPQPNWQSELERRLPILKDIKEITLTPDMIPLTTEESEALIVLGTSSEQKAADYLLAILANDLRTGAKSKAAYHLAQGHSEKEGIKDAVCAAALNHPDPKVRAAVIHGMHLLSYTEWIEKLALEGLLDTDPKVRNAANFALQTFQLNYNTKYLGRSEVGRMYPWVNLLRIRVAASELKDKDQILALIDQLLAQIAEGFSRH